MSEEIINEDVLMENLPKSIGLEFARICQTLSEISISFVFIHPITARIIF